MEKTERRFVVWANVSGSWFCMTVLHESKEDAERLFGSMPLFLHKQGNDAEAEEWRNARHVIAPVDIPVPPEVAAETE